MADARPARSDLETFQARLDALVLDLKSVAASATGAADRLAGTNLGDFLMAFGPQIVAEAFEKLKVDKKEKEELQKKLDDVSKERDDLKSRAPEQAVLDDLGNFLHPPEPTPPAGGPPAPAAV